MEIKTSDIPQADRIESVLMAIIAVGNGATTDMSIADSIPNIEGDARQGRYYRNAAELLGFIKNYRNNSVLTDLGKKLLNNAQLNNPLFINSVLAMKVFQILIPYLEINVRGVTRQQLIDYLQSISDPNMGTSMIPRRISTIIAWASSIDIIRFTNDRYYFNNIFSKKLPYFQLNQIEQPILPVSGELAEYKEVLSKANRAKGIISYYKENAKLERSNTAHSNLVDIVATRLRDYGAVPKCNQLIDLAVKLDHSYLFEMKSTTNRNIRNQIRRGLSQLYEYRYLQNKPEAKLVLVIENPLNVENEWMIDYVENDRGIYLIWDGQDTLYGSERSRYDLSFLALN